MSESGAAKPPPLRPHSGDAAAEFEPFYFAQMADCQIGMQSGNVEWEAEVEMARRAVACVNRMSPPPKFATMCGDLINAFPEEDGSNDKIRAKQTADLKDALKDLRKDVPFICVCGNHDIGQVPTPATIAEWEKTWGPDHFSFEVNNCRMLVLNSQFFKDATHTKELAAKQVDWIKEQLTLSQADPKIGRKGNKHTVVFSHIPPFVRNHDEAEQWCNWPEGPRKEIMDLCVEHGVRWWFTGHFHNNAVAQYKTIELVITSAAGCRIVEPDGWDYANGFRNNERLKLAIGDNESGFRLVHVGEKGLHHRFFTLQDMPTALTPGIFEASAAKTAGSAAAQSDQAASPSDQEEHPPSLPVAATTDAPPAHKKSRTSEPRTLTAPRQ